MKKNQVTTITKNIIRDSNELIYSREIPICGKIYLKNKKIKFQNKFQEKKLP